VLGKGSTKAQHDPLIVPGKPHGVEFSVRAHGSYVRILVDDGLATGATMRAAVKALRQLQLERIIVAVPCGQRRTPRHDGCWATTGTTTRAARRAR
jgi:pyrimidine operon attenuation protein/uracil phosphoribosyltransferase